MKNILLVIAGLPNGGAEKQIIKLWKLLNGNGYNCYLLIFNKKNKIFDKFSWIKNNEKFLSLELSGDEKFLFFKIIKGLIKVYKDKKISIVISFLNIANFFVRISKVIYSKISVLTSIRSNFKLQYSTKEKVFELMLSPLSKIVFTNSKTTIKQLSKYFWIKIVYLPNIIECKNNIIYNAKKNDSDIFNIISIGRFSKEKNFEFLVEVAKNLKDENIVFTILGDGQLKYKIENRIKKYNLKNIILTGQVENPEYYLENADLFFMPSLYEGLSNAMLEAICNNVLVFISKNSNGSEIIENNKNGFVFDDFDVKKVSKQIVNIKEMDKIKKEKMTDNAKKKIQNELSDQKVLKILKEYL